MTSIVLEAFDAVSEGYSADRVVADPDLNAQFIAQCRARKSTSPATKLNRTLLNLRKRGALSGRARARRTSFPGEDEYRFASEMAVRFLERREHVSLDAIICNPRLAAEFDQLAAGISPGYSSLEYRWAALNVRKAKGLKPEMLARVAPATRVSSFRVDQINANELPPSPGLYLIFASKNVLYVGETENLRTRLKKHLEHSDNKGLARWIWDSGTDDVHVEIQVLDPGITVRVRKALELELIRSRQPLFNVQR